MRIATEELKATNVMLPTKMMQQLDAIAKQEGGSSRASLIRRACAEFLRRQGQTLQTEEELA